jgi:hypothetical protein
MRRRRALEILGSAASAPVLFPGLALDELTALGVRVRRGLVPGVSRDIETLTPEQARTVTALAEVIIPETDTPGATTAGVVDFVDVLLTDWLDAGERHRFLNGIDDVGRRAYDLELAAFADLSPEGRISIVAGLDAEIEAVRQDPELKASDYFFYDMKRFTLAGYFTSEVGLRALGYRMVPGAFEGCVLVGEHAEGGDR